MSADGYTGISLAGRWECGGCGESGDGWWDQQEGLRLLDQDQRPFDPGLHVCDFE